MPTPAPLLRPLSDRRSARPRLTSVLATSLALLALTGCQTYTDKTAGRDSAVRTGDIASAVARANKDAEQNKDNKDTVLYRLEQGAILRTAALANLPAPANPTAGALPALTSVGATQTNEALNGATPEQISARIAYLTRSLAAFADAASRIDEYEAAAKVRVGSEAGALFTNQANLPYRGRAYDKVMLHTYQALNYLQLGDADAARVELNRALQRQRDAVAANAKRIDEAQKLADEAKSEGVQDEQGRKGSAYDVDRAKSNPATAAGLGSIESKFNAAILPYGDYVNPFTTFLDALVFTHQGTDASDLERARKSWERVVNFAPANTYARADYVAVEPDLQTAAAVANPAPPAPNGLVYVIFETGSAPYREQTRIDIPLFLVTGGISYAGAAFPRIETVSGHASQIQIRTSDGANYPGALVASIDSVVAQDFKNEWPSILTKTLISTGTKATIDAVLQKQIQDQAGATGALLFRLATAATQAAVNIADTRSWRSLPKEFHYARLAAPADRQLTLSAGVQTTTVAVEPAAVTVVYVKSTGSYAPLLVSQFVLKK